TVDGPRTDVSDMTRFAYDARGDLVSITDALGHRTEITAHDAHGRPVAIREPNGTVTALTYSMPPIPTGFFERAHATTDTMPTAIPRTTPTMDSSTATTIG
ncbi:MAG: RHS repeat domain-containing protein, partial [Gammaproteobacteria bacterium]